MNRKRNSFKLSKCSSILGCLVCFNPHHTFNILSKSIPRIFVDSCSSNGCDTIYNIYNTFIYFHVLNALSEMDGIREFCDLPIIIFRHQGSSNRLSFSNPFPQTGDFIIVSVILSNFFFGYSLYPHKLSSWLTKFVTGVCASMV